MYTIPRIDVLVSASFSSTPGPLIAANYVATNPILAATSTLGRPLSGLQPNITINIVEPGAMYVERLNQVDFRIGKLFRTGVARTRVNLDIYNAFNNDTIRTVNNTYTVWQRPTTILLARFMKISATLDF
jgi:hypothetical protein